MSLPPAEDRSNAYFVVAVVKRNSSYAFTLDELRGKRSCHPGFGSPAGWDIPVGALVQRGFIRPKDCDVLTGTTPRRHTHMFTGVYWGWASSEGCGPLPAGPQRRQPQRDFLFFLDVPLALGKVREYSWPHPGQWCLALWRVPGPLPTYSEWNVSGGRGAGQAHWFWAWLTLSWLTGCLVQSLGIWGALLGSGQPSV